MSKVILLLTIFLIPILPATSQFGFEQIKVLVFIAGVSLASLFWIKENWKKKIKYSITAKAGGVFIGILALTSIFGINPKLSFLGVQPYFQGVILYAYLFLFFILVRDFNIKKDIWIKILIGSSCIVSFLAIRDFISINLLGQNFPTYAGRVVSSFGQPNFYAGFLLLILPFTLGRNWWVSIFLILGILASESRTAYLLMFGLLVFQCLKKLKIKNVLVIFGILILLFTGFVLGQVLEGVSQKEIIQIQDSEWLFHNSPEKRYFIFPIIGELIVKKPLFGYGLDNMQSSFSGFFKGVNFNITTDPAYHSLKDLIVDRSHNYPLDLLFFSGIFGLISWLWLVFLVFKKAKGVLLLGLITYLIWIQFQNQSIVHLIYFWLIVGLVDKSYKV